MDNSFKPQGEFKPDGEFKPQGEFNAPEPPRQFVELTPATATKLPYEKSAKVALLFALFGILVFVVGLVLLIPSVFSNLTISLGNTFPYILLAIFLACTVCYLIGIILSTIGVKAKYSKSIWALIISCLLLIFPLIVLVYTISVADLAKAFLDISNFVY